MTLSVTENGITITPTREKALAYLAISELIADSEVWKAIVAQPNWKIDDIDTLATAATSSRSDAYERINFERIEDERDNEKGKIELPSCIVRYATGQLISERISAGAFDVQGSFFIEFILKVPAELFGSGKLMVCDFTEKIDAIEQDMQLVSSSGDRLEILNRQILQLGELDPDVTQGVRSRTVEYQVNFISG